MQQYGTVTIKKYADGNNTPHVEDKVVTEAPLQLVLTYTQQGKRIRETLTVTMRTPGDDFNLVRGFLFAEGIIRKAAEITLIKYTHDDESSIDVELRDDVDVNLDEARRSFLSTSACGFCGKLEDSSQRVLHILPCTNLQVTDTVLYTLPAMMQSPGSLYAETGGAHAVALVRADGSLLHTSEDVGRHNAMDKLVGAMLKKQLLPLTDAMVVFSGRLSYELVQKSIAAGITMVCALGAPSTLAIELAEEYGITLIGFLKATGFNVYNGEHRVVTTTPKTV